MIMSLKQVPFALALVFSGLAAVLAQDQNVQFNQVVNINGDMQINRITFPDQSRIETFSQTQRQLIVNQNNAPLPASHVVGSTGQPFVQISPLTLNIQTNNANDLVGGQVIMPIDKAVLAQNQVLIDNTFIAKLSDDRQAWVIIESEKSINDAESNIRMTRQTSIDGEYIVLGRQSAETGVSLAPFSQDPNQAVRVEGGGIQEVEFTDGFRMSIRANQALAIQADVINGISANMIVSGTQPVNNFRYLVSSNLAGLTPDLNRMAAVVQIPLNAQKLMAAAQQMGARATDSIALSIEQRGVLGNPGGAQLLAPARQRRQEQREGGNGGNGDRQRQREGQDENQGGNRGGNRGGNQGEDQQSNETASSTESAAEATATSTEAAPPAESTAPPAEQQPPAQAPPAAAPPAALPPAATLLLLEPTFTPIARQTLLDEENSRIAVPVDSVDGEFILVMSIGGQAQQPPAAQVPAGGQVQQPQVPAAGGQVSQPQTPAAPAAPATPAGQIPTSPRPAPGQFQQIPNNQIPTAPGNVVPGQTDTPVGGTMGMIPITKRQDANGQLLGQQGAITISMDRLSAMAARQTNGAGWVGVMIDQYVSQSTGQPIPDRQPTTPQPQLPAAARRSPGRKTRRVRF